MQRSEAEPEQLLDVRLPLVHEVEAGDPAVDDAVLHVLRNVRGPHEQDVDGSVAAGERERSVAGPLGPEPGVLEERDGRLAKTALRRDRDRQALRASLRLRRSSACR